MKMTGAQAIIEALKTENVNVVFGYPGAAICPFYDVLRESGIRHILTRHEQGAAHAASGYARVTGKTGVCVATSGPGATNLITGIATAYMDSIPIVAITGQVSTEQIGKDVFQEADITGATAPFCKHNYLVKNADELPRIIREAFHIASTGRPGPVLIDVPIDVQEQEIWFEYPQNVEIRGYKPTYKGHSLQIKRIADAIAKAKAPIICAGGGVISGNAVDELLCFAEKCCIPVTTTLMGKGAISSKHALYLGMVGSHGSKAANVAIHSTDLLLIMGARVGDRAIIGTDKIAENAQIVHIDIDPAEIGKNIDVSIPVVGDIKDILAELASIVEKGDVKEWNDRLKQFKQGETSFCQDIADCGYVNPKYLLAMLSEMIDRDTVITTEVGQNQIWAANHCCLESPRTFITSGGLGTMGYGLPAAVGVKIGRPELKVIALSGDGSFQMSMQELGTIKQNRLGIKIILFNNLSLGMVREVQRSKYCGRYSQVDLSENPDFIKLVEAYGFKGERITENSQVKKALEKMLSDDDTYLVECMVSPDEPTL
ncbi:MAG: biosynthetic-type acetolactate synthase large subunit [Acetivibrionales bacterium]